MTPLPFQSLDIVLLLFQERCLLLLSHFGCVFGIYKELVVSTDLPETVRRAGRTSTDLILKLKVPQR